MNRKLLFTIAVLALATTVSRAQSGADGLLMSDNNYVGTARTLGMGNAFTALGGDIGSVGINPAGSAVAPYCTVTLTPGLVVSSSNAHGRNGFGNTISTNDTRAALPNYGAVFNFDTHRSTGLKGVSFGIVLNETNTFFDNTIASGENPYTTMAGSFASGATGLKFENITGDNRYNDNYIGDWAYVLANEAGLISRITDSDEDYVGATQGYKKMSGGGYEFYNLGSVAQTFGRTVSGAKRDYVFNLGFNIGDMVYIGANLGVVELGYKYEQFIRESPGAGEAENFTVSFEDGDPTSLYALKHNYFYDAHGVGVYGKFGVIVTPSSFIRIGAAIQTPTSTTIDEGWYSSAEARFNDTYFSRSDATPSLSNTYNLISPFRANFGLATTIASSAIISVDYELANYKTMKFRPDRGNDETIYFDTNTDIRNFYGISHELRIGAEYKPIECLSLRAGYNLKTCPEKYLDESVNRYKYFNSNNNSFALGLGYSTKGSFFIDGAVRLLKYAKEYITPYNYYQLDPDGNVVVNNDVVVPEITLNRYLWTVSLTCGFRF